MYVWDIMKKQTTEDAPKDTPPAPAKTKKKKRAQMAAGIDQSTGGETKRIRPSHIKCEHGNNSSRWACYDTATVCAEINTLKREQSPDEELADIPHAKLVSLIGEKCCFTAAEIFRRISSLLTEGQIEPVSISLSKAGVPRLETGYLRHVAAVVLELWGSLVSVPGAKGVKVTGLFALVVPAPKGQGGYNRSARRNLAENLQRKDVTAVDIARYIVTALQSYDDDGVPLTKAAVAKEVEKKPATLARYLQLWNDTPPARLLAVHEGTITMAAALAANKNEGRGDTTGTQPGMKISKMRHALAQTETRPPPTEDLSASDVQLLLQCVVGKTPDELPPHVLAWAEWIQTDKAKSKKPADKPTKAAPPNLAGTTTTAVAVQGDS